MSQRLIRLSIHLSRTENLQVNKPEVVLAALNIGHAIMDLRRLVQTPALDSPKREKLEKVIAAFRTLSSSPRQISSMLGHTRDYFSKESFVLQPEILLALRKASMAFESFARFQRQI